MSDEIKSYLVNLKKFPDKILNPADFKVYLKNRPRHLLRSKSTWNCVSNRAKLCKNVFFFFDHLRKPLSAFFIAESAIYIISTTHHSTLEISTDKIEPIILCILASLESLSDWNDKGQFPSPAPSTLAPWLDGLNSTSRGACTTFKIFWPYQNNKSILS